MEKTICTIAFPLLWMLVIWSARNGEQQQLTNYNRNPDSQVTTIIAAIIYTTVLVTYFFGVYGS